MDPDTSQAHKLTTSIDQAEGNTMNVSEFISSNKRVVLALLLVAVVMIAVAINNATQGKLGIDRTLTVDGIARNVLFYLAVFGFIALSRRISRSK